MLTLLLLSALLFSNLDNSETGYWEYRIVSTVEQGGLGRSAIVSQNGVVRKDTIVSSPAEKYVFQKTPKSRTESRIDTAEAIPLHNPYTLFATDFQHVAMNDALITGKINEMVLSGWELAFVASSMGASEDLRQMVVKYHFRKWHSR